MESLAKMISALASLAWPIVLAVLLYKLFGPIQRLVESARARKFTIKVGGNELTMEEASEQQRTIVVDLQAKIAELEKQVVKGEPAIHPETFEIARSHKRLLWVDDRPKNNSYLVAALEDRGVEVATALSTKEALLRVREKPFDIIISDMGRPEGDHSGIDLAGRLKEMDVKTPLFIFCGSWAAKNLREKALASGVIGITSSGSSLLSMLPLSNGS